LSTARNVKDVFAAMQRAGVPKRFTYDFLKQLGHGSSANRPVIAVLKALRFLDDGGVPTGRYRRYKDPAHAGAVMAEALRDAYADVFTVDQAANTRTTNELKGIFARLSGKGDAVNLKMATTFKTLSEMADWTATPAAEASEQEAAEGEPPDLAEVEATRPYPRTTDGAPDLGVRVHHDVHVHLPVSTDIAVYDAIFRSLRENLR
jgi:hypothetical protein